MESRYCPKCKKKLKGIPEQKKNFRSVVPLWHFSCDNGHGPFYQHETLKEEELESYRGYYQVPGSWGEVREFIITVGLSSGYGKEKIFPPQAVAEAAMEWMRLRIKDGRPFLTGSCMEGTVCYAYPASSGPISQSEPVVLFSGEVVPLYNRNLKHESVIEALNDLAAHLGRATEQTRVYVRYLDHTWILQKKGKETPGEGGF